MSAIDEFDARLGRQVPRRRDVSAASLCTWRVGGPLRLLVEPRDLEDLAAVARALEGDLRVLVVGRGSNLLVADAGFDGVAILLGEGFAHLDLPPHGSGGGGDAQVVSAGASLALPVLARRTAAAGLTGLEFFVGIPGSVGGAVRMNAGGHGSQSADVLESATVFDLRAATQRTRGADTFGFSYRHSNVGPDEVVVAAQWRVRPDDALRCTARVDEIVAWRRAHQPGGANAGSVFANPPGDSAGRLVEACGLKGARRGGAVVSHKHANFIQAESAATADDVAALIAYVSAEVARRTGVVLRPEVQFAGSPGEDPRGRDDEVRS